MEHGRNALVPQDGFGAIEPAEHSTCQRKHEQRGAEGDLARRIHGLRYAEISDEPDGIQKRRQGHGVTNRAVKEDSRSFHGTPDFQMRKA